MKLILSTAALALLLATSAAAAFEQRGVASVYATTGADADGYAWARSASSERVNPEALTAAHKSLPFGTMVRVCRATRKNLLQVRCVVVRINDRGPFVRGRVIDLTPAGARAIGMSRLAPVTLSSAR